MTKKTISDGTVHAVPSDVRQALDSDAAARAMWEDLTPLARNEWICWVTFVKKEETRKNHVKRLVSELKEGIRRPCCWLGCIHRKDKSVSPSVQAILDRRSKKKEKGQADAYSKRLSLLKSFVISDHRSVPRTSPEHHALARKVAGQAQRILPLFENEHPKDLRPRLAINAIRAWGQDKLQLNMKEVRKFSLNAHAAAREAGTDAARFAARAAGQAVAVWHVPTHAGAVLYYAQKARAAHKKRSGILGLAKAVASE